MLRDFNELKWLGAICFALLLGLVIFPSEKYREEKANDFAESTDIFKASGRITGEESRPPSIGRAEIGEDSVSGREANLIIGSVREHLTGNTISAVVELYYLDMYGEKVLLQSAISSTNGGFEFVVETPGEYELQIDPNSLSYGLRPSSALSSTDSLRLNRKDLERSMVIIEEERGSSVSRVDLYAFLKGRLEGILLDQFGEPIQGALVSAYSRIGPQKGGYTFNAMTGESGKFVIENCSPGWVSVSFSLNSATSVPHRVLIPPILSQFEFVEGQVVNFGVVVADAGKLEITGKMLDQFGVPFVGVSVLCKLKAQGYADFIQKSITNDRGGFVLAGLASGEYSVLTTRDGFGRSRKLSELQFAIEDYAIPVVLGQDSFDVGTVVSQRPILFSTRLALIDPDFRDSFFEDYSIRVESQFDEKIQAQVWDAEAAGNYVRHAYDWDTAPPWFNKEPEVEWRVAADGIGTISCLLPHSPIVVTVAKKNEDKELSIVLYPSVGHRQVTFIELPY